MLFHLEEDNRGGVFGWVLPDNPTAIPTIKVLKADGSSFEVKANILRTDLSDRGLHETGMIGFNLEKSSHPEALENLDEIEIRETATNVLIFRRYRKDLHLAQKLFRFELRAMPDPQLEKLFAQRFTYFYGAAQRYPQDTAFGIVNNPVAKSLYISGHPNYQQYEPLLKERGYKIVSLIRNPYEEMAERLLFARYALSSNLPPFVADHLFGLEPLIEIAKNIKFDDIASLRAAFAALTEPQRLALSNPLVRTLACTVDDRPKLPHVEIALSKLARMDAVGVRNRFGEFKSVLQEVTGIDLLGDYELTDLSWVQRVSEQLAEIKQAKNLIALDLDLYSYTEEAITEALGPAPASTAVV
jgi:hypothetical protein